MMSLGRALLAALSLTWIDGAWCLKFQEISPLKAAMLVKSWQGLLEEVDQKVGVVPELGGTSVGVQRFGPELRRRTYCARQFERFHESTFGLALADKAESEASKASKREELAVLEIHGVKRGPRCVVYAGLTSPATMSLVERCEDEWSVLALAVNPTERAMPVISAAEQGTLVELYKLSSDAGASLRVETSVAGTLAADRDILGLSALTEEWLRCDLGSCATAES